MNCRRCTYLGAYDAKKCREYFTWMFQILFPEGGVTACIHAMQYGAMLLQTDWRNYRFSGKYGNML